MSEPFIGEIRMFGGRYAPRGWAFCNGQLLSVSEYDALFSLLGTSFGGDGRSNFALPDLRGRAPAHPGSNLRWGQQSGGPGSGAASTTTNVDIARGLSASTASAGFAVAPGQVAPHPTLSVHFIIALTGIYPSRN